MLHAWWSNSLQKHESCGASERPPCPPLSSDHANTINDHGANSDTGLSNMKDEEQGTMQSSWEELNSFSFIYAEVSWPPSDRKLKNPKQEYRTPHLHIWDANQENKHSKTVLAIHSPIIWNPISYLFHFIQMNRPHLVELRNSVPVSAAAPAAVPTGRAVRWSPSDSRGWKTEKTFALGSNSGWCYLSSWFLIFPFGLCTVSDAFFGFVEKCSLVLERDLGILVTLAITRNFSSEALSGIMTRKSLDL